MFLQTKKSYSLVDAQRVKNIIDIEANPFTKNADLKSGAAARGINNLRAKIKTLIEQKADEAGVPNIKELNKNTQLSKNLGEAIRESIDQGKGISGKDIFTTSLTTGLLIADQQLTNLLPKEMLVPLIALNGLRHVPGVRAALSRVYAGLDKPTARALKSAVTRRSMDTKTRKAYTKYISDVLKEVNTIPAVASFISQKTRGNDLSEGGESLDDILNEIEQPTEGESLADILAELEGN